MHRLILLGVLLVWLLPAANRTNLTIQVKSKSGKPVDHANVIVKFISSHSIVKLGKGVRTAWELQTNQEGVAKIPTIPQGKILIQIIAKNYQTFGQSFDVDEENKTIDITLSPPQQQYSAH